MILKRNHTDCFICTLPGKSGGACLGWILLLCLLVSPAGLAGEKPLARITVEAGDSSLEPMPLSVSLTGLAVPLGSGLRLEELRDGKRVPVPSQIEPGHSPLLWWILTERAESGGARIFELMQPEVPGPGVGAQLMVRAARDERALTLLLNEEPVFAFNHAVIPPPEGADPLYARSGFIHPLFSPAGAELTRIHPADHIHHVGLWNPYAQTRFEGREVDFWNLKKGQGTVRFVRFASVTEGPVFGSFRALLEHVDLKAPGKEKAALNEEWDVRLWRLGGKEAGFTVCDFTSTLACASSSPVTLLKYRYGGLGFRAVSSFKEGDYLTSEGKQRKDGQGTRAKWCMVYGPTDKGPAGVLFMDHAQNRDHPQPMRIWSHTDDIFFSFCPIQQADWNLVPGQEYVLRYRLFIYNGSITSEKAGRLWRNFSRPPRVKIEIP